MRSVAIADNRSVGLVENEAPHPAAGEVGISVSYCGICGSDLHMLEYPMVPAGMVLGHEFSGVVAEVGEGVEHWQAGDRVVVLPIDECGECAACRTGDGVCVAGLMRGPGLGRPGGFSEFVVVPAGMLHELPESVSDQAGALAEPLAVAVRGVRRSQAESEDAVCVLGAGPIGYMTAAALRAGGFSNVVIVEPNVARRDKVAELGFPTCSADDAERFVTTVLGGPPRVVIDCTGHPSGAPLAIQLLPQQGRLVIVGIPSGPVPTDYSLVATKELTIVGSLAYTKRDFAEAIDHLAGGRVPVDQIVTTVSPLDDAWTKIQELASGTSSDVKVLFHP